MKHFTLPRFWEHYRDLPDDIQDLADRKFELLKSNPRHPSLHLKKIGNKKQLWSVRVGLHYRALGREKPEGIRVVLDRDARRVRQTHFVNASLPHNPSLHLTADPAACVAAMPSSRRAATCQKCFRPIPPQVNSIVMQKRAICS